MITRLYRPRTERMIGGVCGGLGLYFGIDPVIVRLLFVVLVFATGVGFFLYPLLWVVMPEEVPGATLPPDARFDPQTGQPLPQRPATQQTVPLAADTPDADANNSAPRQTIGAQRSQTLAVILLGVGAMVLLSNLSDVFGIYLGNIAVPLLLIGVGVYLLRSGRVH